MQIPLLSVMVVDDGLSVCLLPVGRSIDCSFSWDENSVTENTFWRFKSNYFAVVVIVVVVMVAIYSQSILKSIIQQWRWTDRPKDQPINDDGVRKFCLMIWVIVRFQNSEGCLTGFGCANRQFTTSQQFNSSTIFSFSSSFVPTIDFGFAGEDEGRDSVFCLGGLSRSAKRCHIKIKWFSFTVWDDIQTRKKHRF